MERLPEYGPSAAEAQLELAARALEDAVVLACYGGADAPRAAALCGNVRTTATELAVGARDQPRRHQ